MNDPNDNLPGTSTRNANPSAGGGNAVYGLGAIGAAIFYFQQADSGWEYVFALPKAIVWPAFVIYDVLTFLS